MNSMDPKAAQTSGSSKDSPGGADTVSQKPTGSQTPVSITGSGGKETEIGFGLGNLEIPELTEIGKDVELPKEVEKAGVKVTPTAVTVSPSLRKLGVRSTAPSIQVAGGQHQAVPLGDDQIAQGLKQNLTSSWRWLAEWCVRKLKQLGRAVQKKGTVSR